MTLLQESLVRVSALIVILGAICPVMAATWSVFYRLVVSNENIGIHRRKGKKRRRLKTILLVSITAALLFSSSWMMRDTVIPDDVSDPLPSQLGYARNLYKLSGYCGEAKIYIDRWPQYADYIMGDW